VRRQWVECDCCEEMVPLADSCDECELCIDCCECVNVGGELFDADELGLDPEEDDKRLYNRS